MISNLSMTQTVSQFLVGHTPWVALCPCMVVTTLITELSVCCTGMWAQAKWINGTTVFGHLGISSDHITSLGRTRVFSNEIFQTTLKEECYISAKTLHLVLQSMLPSQSNLREVNRLLAPCFQASLPFDNYPPFIPPIAFSYLLWQI